MRTKTLLIAAAALVAGVISSEAQTVYSVNIAGYTTSIPTNGAFVLLSNPLDNGTNTLKSLFPGINGGTSVQIWNGSGFDVYQFALGSWANVANNTNADNLLIPPGEGFFMLLGGSKKYTNTFSGNVVGPSGSSVTNIIQKGLQLEGALVPFADYVTNTATVNLIVKGGTTIQLWDPVGQQFVLYQFALGAWGNINTGLPQVPQIAPGQGFFVQPNGSNTNIWVQASP